jgi:hypothetical protein
MFEKDIIKFRADLMKHKTKLALSAEEQDWTMEGKTYDIPSIVVMP